MADCPELDELINRFGEDAMDKIAEDITEMMISEISGAPTFSQGLEEGDDGYVWLADVVAHDRINHSMSGSFWLGGTEYAFEAESGDRCGWVWRSISADSSIPELDRAVTTYALVPRRDVVDGHVKEGKASLLLAKWDAFLNREEVATIAGKYAYDKHFSPGVVTERYWRERADKYGFAITTSESASETRQELEALVGGHNDR